MRARRGRAGREEGFVLFLAMLFLLVLTILGISVMFTATTEGLLSSNETKVSKIFYAASSGIDFSPSVTAASISSTLPSDAQ